MFTRTTVLRLLPVLALVAAGCESEKNGQIAVYPVHGQVVYDGKPAAGVKVYLLPLDAPTRPVIPANPHAVTKSDGTFAVTTFADEDGAAEGKYLAVLLWRGETEPGEEESDKDRLLGWYDAANSKLEVKVKAGENKLSPFKLPVRTEPPTPGSEGIPGRN